MHGKSETITMCEDTSWDSLQVTEDPNSLVAKVVRTLSAFVDTPSHRFLLGTLFGDALDEQAAVFAIDHCCNLLYCILVLCGFFLFDVQKMATITVVTLPLGPTLVLLFLMLPYAIISLFALRPVAAVRRVP